MLVVQTPLILTNKRCKLTQREGRQISGGIVNDPIVKKALTSDSESNHNPPYAQKNQFIGQKIHCGNEVPVNQTLS